VSRFIQFLTCMLCISLFLVACDSVNTSVHGSYGVRYGHGYGYGYPGYYPTGRIGPPVSQPAPVGTQPRHSNLQSEINRTVPQG